MCPVTYSTILLLWAQYTVKFAIYKLWLWQGIGLSFSIGFGWSWVNLLTTSFPYLSNFSGLKRNIKGFHLQQLMHLQNHAVGTYHSSRATLVKTLIKKKGWIRNVENCILISALSPPSSYMTLDRLLHLSDWVNSFILKKKKANLDVLKFPLQNNISSFKSSSELTCISRFCRRWQR